MGRTPHTRTLAGLLAGGALAVTLGACGTDTVPPDSDLIAGKRAFVKSCGACHVLNRAGTKGVSGPNLDDAFRRALTDGLGRDTVRGVVYGQINHPARISKDSVAFMPAGLVKGKLAKDVAAYVASVAARPGKDTGRLGSAVAAPGAGKPAQSKDGKLDIPADPGGQLAYITKVASASAGALEVTSENPSAIPHNIAIDGNGVDEKGKVVTNGGVSKVSITLKPGQYAFYCSVAGHREGGMEGKLTVK